LAVVVHVLSDYAFKKYLQHCSASDLLLLRGLLLKVCSLWQQQQQQRRRQLFQTVSQQGSNGGGAAAASGQQQLLNAL
jgi:hypothetical protein